MSEQLNWEPIWDPTDPDKLGLNWQDYPSRKTPLNAENLNQANDAIDILDDRIVAIGQQIDSLSTVGPALAAETTARQAADTQLSLQIGTSISTHNQSAAAHLDIRSAITSESTARAAADANLQDQIDNIQVTANGAINGVPLTSTTVSGDLKLVKRNTTQGWNSQSTLVGLKDVVYLYTDHQTIDNGDGTITYKPGAKIGDGSAYLIDTPFIGDDDPRVSAHILNNEIHITQSEREFWNNKWSGYIDGNNPEILHFTKNAVTLGGNIYG